MNFSAISKVKFFIHPKDITKNLSAKRFLLSCSQFRVNNLAADLALETGEWLKDGQDPKLDIQFCILSSLILLLGNGDSMSLKTSELTYSDILSQIRPLAEKASEQLDA